MLQHNLPALIVSARTTGRSHMLSLNNSFRHAKTQKATPWLHPSDGISLDLYKTKNLEISDKYQNKAKLCLAFTPPPPLIHTPCPLTPTTICQKLSYKFLFVSIFKHDGEELSLYMKGRLCVYPAAPGNKRKPPLLLVEAGKGSETAGLAREVNGG